MSKYTTEVRYIVEVNSSEDLSIDGRIAEAAPRIFNFSFPIWDEADRLNLECLILQHYYMREIGFETVGQWKLQLRTKLREIMPYYVELWKTTQLEYPLLTDVDIWEDHTGERSGEFDSTRSGTSKTESSDNETSSSSTTGSTASSDLPQVRITGPYDLDYANQQQVSSGTGETSSEMSGNTSTATDTTDKNTHSDRDSWARHRTGFSGNRSYTQLITEYRDALLQIPQMIIEDLHDLFMGLW